MTAALRPTLVLLALFTLLLGGVYPSALWLGAHLFWPDLAEGSLVHDSAGKLVGSSLIAQPFEGEGYFWPRPSATSGEPYTFMTSGASHLNPHNPQWLKTVEDRARSLEPSGEGQPVPLDLVTASGSGLDPHISARAAFFQIPRIAKARHLEEEILRHFVEEHVEGKTLGLWGERRVNVLLTNRALDQRFGPVGGAHAR